MVDEDTSRISDADFLQAFHKGKEHFDNNRLEEARVFLEKAYKMKPSDEKVLNLLGMVYFKLNYLPEAEEIYGKLIATNSNIYVLHSNLGLIRLKLGKIKEAEESLKKALDLQPHNPKAQVYMGLLYEKAGDFTKALHYFEKGGAQKLVEQLHEKMVSMKKEDVIEDAEILEVMDKKPAVIQEEPQKEEEINLFAEEKRTIQEESALDEEKKEDIHKYFAPEAKTVPEEKEQFSEEVPPQHIVSKMAEELGLEVNPPLGTEQLAEEIIQEEPEEDVMVLEETTPQAIAEPEKEEILHKEQNLPTNIQGMAKELGVEIGFNPQIVASANVAPEKEHIVIEPQPEIKRGQPPSEIIAAEKKSISMDKPFIEEKVEIIKSGNIPSVSKETIQIEETIPDQKQKVVIQATSPQSQKEVRPERPTFITSPDMFVIKPLSLDFFSRDRFYIQPLTGADRFLLVDPHLLEIVLSEEIIIRKGTMSSFCGEIKFDFLKSEGIGTPLIRCQGAGVIFLSHERREIFLFSLNNEEVNIEESHFLVAQGSLTITGKHIENTITYLNIKGVGTLGISIKSHPLTLNVLSSMPVNIYSDALIAWSGNLNALIIREDDIKGIMTCSEENAVPLKFKGIGDVVVEQGSLWGDRRTKL